MGKKINREITHNIKVATENRTNLRCREIESRQKGYDSSNANKLNKLV